MLLSGIGSTEGFPKKNRKMSLGRMTLPKIHLIWYRHPSLSPAGLTSSKESRWKSCVGPIFFFLYLKEWSSFKICTPIQFTFFDMKYRFQRENTLMIMRGGCVLTFVPKSWIWIWSYVKTMVGICPGGNKPRGQDYLSTNNHQQAIVITNVIWLGNFNNNAY